jgi:uncharacterized protein YdcH (DUF465 family)
MIEVFYQQRKNGKTTKMIEMSNKLNQTIIVNNRTTANLIAAQAEDMGLIIPHPRGVMDYISLTSKDGFNSRDLEPVLIDEAQHVLRELLKAKITAMTITDWSDYDVLDDLNDVKNSLAEEVTLLKQLLTLKDNEIDRLNKTVDRLASKE